ncbi:MAG TPA: nucleotide sugar dehydrogenase [Bryobacteraceae bacterium]|nr:nucleotide sugar dehydrogenase [Bryobacteraceae bacterium]
MNSNSESSRVAVLGLGYVGCVTAACLAATGHQVCGTDRDEHKVQAVQRGDAPFYEPGLAELVKENVAAGRLTATPSTAEAIRDADVAMVCVGTPSERNGNIALEQLRRVTEDVAGACAGRTKPLALTVRSTVFPGTCEQVVIPAVSGIPAISVVANPEFLREGVAVKDFREPALIVVAGTDAAAVQRVASLYAGLNVEPCLVALRTAEMIKYACNAFHAVKIGFANEIGAMAESLGVAPEEVLGTLCRDDRLNISPAYLKPGFAFGGSCLPKDLRVLRYRAARLDLKLPLLESVLPANEEHLRRAIQSAMDLGPVKLGIVGLAFKENSDDLRESPVVGMIEHLIGKGRDLRIFDPHIQMDKIYGSNRNYILSAIPHIGRLLTGDLEEVTAWAGHLVVTQRPSAELAAQIRASGKPVLDVARGLR